MRAKFPLSHRNVGMFTRTGAWSQPYIFLGSDGDDSPTADVSNPRLAAYLSNNILQLFLNNLPKTRAGLKVGQAWLDNGKVSVVE